MRCSPATRTGIFSTDLRPYLCPVLNPLFGLLVTWMAIDGLFLGTRQWKGIVSTGLTALLGNLALLLIGANLLLSVDWWWFRNEQLFPVRGVMVVVFFALLVVFVALRYYEAVYAGRAPF